MPRRSQRDRHGLRGLPWFIAQSGARIEVMLAPSPPRNASEVARGRNSTLEGLFHLYMLNQGILVTPFHSMLLICPATTPEQVERYLAAFAAFCTQVASLPAQA